MPTQRFTRSQLAALGIPPEDPSDLGYSDHLIADEQVCTLKYTEQRRTIFHAEGGFTWAVKYEARLNAGDFEVGDYVPGDHGWHGDVAQAVAAEQRQVLVTRWEPVAD